MNPDPKLDRLRLRIARALTRIIPPGKQPLVSVMIPTWNRGQLLAERTLPPILSQTYRNIEVIVVGDACTDDTAKLVASIGDPRIRFENLEKRGEYPENPLHRWMVGGTAAANRALELTRGAWIAYCDDDDCWTPDHLDVLLDHARQSGAECVYGAGRFQRSRDEWLRIGGVPPGRGKIMHSTVLYRGYLRFMKYDPEAWREQIGGDGQLWKRMRAAGVRFSFLDQVVSEAPLRPGETLAGQNARLEAEKEWKEKGSNESL